MSSDPTSLKFFFSHFQYLVGYLCTSWGRRSLPGPFTLSAVNTSFLQKGYGVVVCGFFV